MKVVVFGLTGFGNIAIQALLDNNIKPEAIITRREKNKYPYFKCEDISSLAKKNKIKVFYDKKFYKKKVDFCLVATYHKKINIKKSNFNKGFNIHPSLLPKFKGKDPINDFIRSKTKLTGVTIHNLTKNFDEGKIYKQYKIKIKKTKKEISKSMRIYFYKSTEYIIKNLTSR